MQKQRSLFDITPKEDTLQTNKRGRPRKQVENITETKKQEVKKKPENKPQTNKKQSVKTDDKGWKDFNKSKPEPLVPVEFYVDTGKEKKDIFRGYRKDTTTTVTDEPYKLVVLRKKYQNIYYREIKGCNSITNCPNEFPSCDKCKNRKK